MKNDPDRTAAQPLAPSTRLVVGGRRPEEQYGFVNTPVYHGSTVLYPTAEDFRARRSRYKYGRRGTPTSDSLESLLADLEGEACAGVALLPSGLGAISAALLAVLKAGDHLLMTDSAYEPTRHVCDHLLTRWGISTTYYDPLIGAGIEALVRPNTRAVFVESPGSLSFEIQDVPAIAEVAHAHGAAVLMDNTWATPLYFRALDHGVDLSIQAGTKYIGGHSDIMFGCVAANAHYADVLRDTVFSLGLCVGPDDMNLALRGLRTLAVRLPSHFAAGVEVATWLEGRPEVSRVLHPALPSHPGHALWKRDFTGACGLFSIVLKPVPETAVDAFLNAIDLFGIGASWGGYESLAIPFDCSKIRTATTWAPGGPTVRFHIGLEAVGDLIANLDEGFAALNAAAQAG
ncbi:Cystathionine beta-lyase [Rhodovulum sp. PH10]|uniref:cystathionine beta-lyase n=1 Tax=Rhodovulum sp. PH10 TaxID=1187851 RepID=UPI00027C2CAD|nr:cystathionine beta-lyase [Rhodovulum sp. PH10]EJW09992.1 Cystathionine beta-lyase [Rhodovulum sp. PH10]